MKLVRVRKVTPLEGFRVLFEFTDDTRREIDLDYYLRGPIFQPLRDNPELFRAMQVEGGAITWPNGADIDPDVLYHNLTPAWAEAEQAQT